MYNTAMKLVITGGHHSSALPVIEELRKRTPQIEILWIGHKHSLAGDLNDTLEYKEITKLGIQFKELKTGKFYNNVNLLSIYKIISGFFSASKILLEFKPDLILSFGGYLAVPVVIAGWFQNIPSITHEQTLVAGYANKLISLFSRKILISFEESARFFDNKKIVFTGIPLRKAIFQPISHNFSVDNTLPYIYVTGGKSGSHLINEVIGIAMPELLNEANVIHQCGDYSVTNDYEKLDKIYTQLKNSVKGKYFLKKFVLEDEIGEVFDKASLVISRSGAHAVSEISVLNKPCILIPIPWVSHNEQYANAQFLHQRGLAEIIEEKNFTPEKIINLVTSMLGNLEKYKFTKPVPEQNNNAAVLIADEIFKLQSK
jgi:UDP-N-acetylglucosamine--N-acetylmuramyl-(pentapeptide) pyrophosphoryl-undecaprenol N-acetylglucosamine transferase